MKLLADACLVLGVVMHLGFAYGEMFPWSRPLLLNSLATKKNIVLDGEQLAFVATIVRNAGIYNVIVASGFLLSLYLRWNFAATGAGTPDLVAGFFFAGALLAGMFGLTLSPATAIQAVLGLVGLFAVMMSGKTS